MRKTIFILLFSFGSICAFTQKHIGINTTNPLAALHVADSSVLFTGPATLPVNPSTPPVSGPGTRLMWYADKAAFRVGTVDGNQWDDLQTGQYSSALGGNVTASGNFSLAAGGGSIASGDFATAIGLNTTASAQSCTTLGAYTTASATFATALGSNTTASGNSATAMGNQTSASGFSSTAMGYQTTATEIGSTAIGYQTIASGAGSTTMGVGTTASNDFSTAIGYQTTASGSTSIAMGANTIASGGYSSAMGFHTTASGSYSTAIGRDCSTNGQVNSFCINGTATATNNSAPNQMMMRFDNYTFWVSASNYAYLIPASNGWAYTSDKNKKEKFVEVDGEDVLKKIAGISFYSWNFKAADTRQYRHYGIMAQDFYKAFGKDKYGIIGNDTTVSPLDLLGVAYSGIKALEKRSAKLAAENSKLKNDNLLLQKEMTDIKNEFADKLALLEIKMNEAIATKEKDGEEKKAVVTNK